MGGGALGAQCLTSKDIVKKLNKDLSNLDEVAATAPDPNMWQEVWNKLYPKSMWQTQTPPRGLAQDPTEKQLLREAVEQEAQRLLLNHKATPHPHQYKMVIRHCRPDRIL